MKTIVILLSLFLFSCGVEVKDAVDYLELERRIPATSSVIPLDANIVYDNAAVIAKSKRYVSQSYNHSTSSHYDSYGLLLPLRAGSFNHQGDALGWNMVSLQTMCMLTQAYKSGRLDSDFDLASDMQQLWADLKSSIIHPDGHLTRHPATTRETSISKDHMAMFQSSLVMMKYFGCENILPDMSNALDKFIRYGAANSWEMGEAGKTDISTTFLNGRHTLYDASSVFGLGYAADDLSLSTSAETTRLNSSIADYINENKYWCRLGYPGSCLRIANAGVYGNHLNYSSVVLFRIGAPSGRNSIYTQIETKAFLEDMGKVGQNIGFPNWLFVAAYRHFVLGSAATYNDINKHLAEDWPDNLPTNTDAIKGWGCSDFIWQRVPEESCGEVPEQQIGTDFLLLFAYTVS